MVSGRWCVDIQRIYAVAHSDGGTASEAIVFLGKTDMPIAGLAAGQHRAARQQSVKVIQRPGLAKGSPEPL